MLLASYAGLPLAAGGVQTNMSEGGLIVLSIGAMLCLAALLIPVNLAARTPRRTGAVSMPPGSAAVQGGVHLGDGRSIAPHRDESAVPFDREQVEQAQAARAQSAEARAGDERRGGEGVAGAG
jgi:hypothetical protein